MLQLPTLLDLKRSKEIQIGSLLLFGFLLTSLLIWFRALSFFDFVTTITFQSITPRFLDTPFSFFSLFGTFEITALLLVLVIVKSKTSWFNTFVILAGFLAILGIETTLKQFLHHPSPPPAFNRYDLPVFFPTSEVQFPFAYPSGHLGRTTYLLVTIWFLLALNLKPASKKRTLLISLFILGFIMAYSRVYLGEHWISDVVGGSLLGAGIGYLVWGLLKTGKFKLTP